MNILQPGRDAGEAATVGETPPPVFLEILRLVEGYRRARDERRTW